MSIMWSTHPKSCIYQVSEILVLKITTITRQLSSLNWNYVIKTRMYVDPPPLIIHLPSFSLIRYVVFEMLKWVCLVIKWPCDLDLSSGNNTILVQTSASNFREICWKDLELARATHFWRLTDTHNHRNGLVSFWTQMDCNYQSLFSATRSCWRWNKIKGAIKNYSAMYVQKKL